jgi:hypothetical protein
MIDFASADPIEPPAPVNKTLRAVKGLFMKRQLSTVTPASDETSQLQDPRRKASNPGPTII